jgi:hypothetical protein
MKKTLVSKLRGASIGGCENLTACPCYQTPPNGFVLSYLNGAYYSLAESLWPLTQPRMFGGKLV